MRRLYRLDMYHNAVTSAMAKTVAPTPIPAAAPTLRPEAPSDEDADEDEEMDGDTAKPRRDKSSEGAAEGEKRAVGGVQLNQHM